MGNLEKEYKAILDLAVTTGMERNDRTGVGCYSLFNQKLSWSLSGAKFPIMTSKKIYSKIFIKEFEWFIKGETNTKLLKDSGITIWDEWADENGDLGKVYGHQLRNFNSQGFDQLEVLLYNLRNSQDSRRHIVSLWNPNELHEMALPPCYLYFQFFVDKHNTLNMFVVQRSADLFLGVPYDIGLFSMFLLYVAEKTFYLPGQIDLQLVDAHVYKNHTKQVNEYIYNPGHEFPDFYYKDEKLYLSNYKSEKSIKAEVAI